VTSPAFNLEPLQAIFGERLRRDVRLAPYTAARIGGPADALLSVESAAELAQAATILWAAHLPFTLLGGGSNVLVSDAGVRGVVLLNRARRIRFRSRANPPSVWAESGANFGLVARQAARKGLGGLEWAAGIPGTVGGAVVGNAGAHGGDMAHDLIVAEILHRSGVRQEWPVERMEYGYRTSTLKSNPGMAVVLSARLRLQARPVDAIQETMQRFQEQRRRTQPPGASMGSMFKNPPGDYAGRLIEAAGLKGRRSGQAQVSPLHANFFINLGGATAADLYRLIRTVRGEVARQSGVQLALEIDLIGDWEGIDDE
jgi:UDP-N-acetylmuramate dehydrogenase